ncbi:pilus assembly protein PilP [Psychrobium sp. 1_MG-2023]|uniref:pilus assembly protein PilP n=1 Tax=Psychrobium sp. 1_MG-2023 TaxID=3062624 RepID=UPI000C32C061|nr:pilus assembly protein PilP [Psychrobium sp. 1_MG-2023]MDP2560996.1 pilus assembly protein PilP [Psychrobium sp. 1_MG-2023]PKF58290.1 pilus assembly protein PilP [Alteromonadales bacterium alter-6D02]
MKRLLSLLLLAPLLTACNDDMTEVQQFVAAVKQTEGIAIEPMPEPLPFKHFEYSASFLRSPFVGPQQELTLDIISQSRDCLQPDINRNKSLLEAYALDSLSMRGSIGFDGELWALIQTNDGDVYKVGTGHYIGLFHGQITQVSEQQIEIIEIVPDGSGCWVERNNSLALNVEE